MTEIQNSKQVSGPEKIWSLVLGLWSFESFDPSTTPSTFPFGCAQGFGLFRATANSGQAFLLRTGFDIVSTVRCPPKGVLRTAEDFDTPVRSVCIHIRNSDLWLFTIRMCEA